MRSARNASAVSLSPRTKTRQKTSVNCKPPGVGIFSRTQPFPLLSMPKDMREELEKIRQRSLEKKKEFQQFAFQGNIIDLAVGVIIGGAFGKIVTSLVNDVIMPLIGMLLGKIDFTTLAIGPLKYGLFLQSIVDFLIVALCIFVAVKQLQRLKKKHTPPPPPPAPEPLEIKLLTEIRDILRAKS